MTTDYKLGPILTAHDHPTAQYAVNVHNPGGLIVARVYGDDPAEAEKNAREVAAARDAIKALRLVLTLHEDPNARAHTPGVFGRYGGFGDLLDPKAAEQVRDVLKKAGAL